MLAMWLAMVLVLSESSRAISLVVLAAGELGEDFEFAFGEGGPDRVGGVLAVGGDRDVALADALQEFPGDLGESTDSPAAVASTAAMIALGGAVLRM